MPQKTSLSEKILLLRRMEIFEALAVAELAAVASVCQDYEAQPDEVFIKKDDPGDSMFLIVRGEVSVSQLGEDGCSLELARLGEGDYVGEMSLFDDAPRSATVTTLGEAHLLVLHKREFEETVREYPQVALQICKELSRRIRALHHRIHAMPVCELPQRALKDQPQNPVAPAPPSP